MKEIFKNIVGFEGYYQISNFGKVKSLEHSVRCRNNHNRIVKEHILIPNLGTNKYLYKSLEK